MKGHFPRACFIRASVLLWTGHFFGIGLIQVSFWQMDIFLVIFLILLWIFFWEYLRLCFSFLFTKGHFSRACCIWASVLFWKGIFLEIGVIRVSVLLTNGHFLVLFLIRFCPYNKGTFSGNIWFSGHFSRALFIRVSVLLTIGHFWFC